MCRLIPLVVMFLLAFAASAQGQLLKKLEEKLRAPVPAAAKEDGELPPPAPGDRPAGHLGVEGGSDPEGGVRIDSFRETGKAKASGLKIGDRIVAVDGTEVKDIEEFGLLLGKLQPGDTVALTVVRAGKEQEFKVALVDPPAVAEEPAEEPGVVESPDAGGPLVAPATPPAAGRASLGITVISLTDELRDRLGVPVRRGAVITKVRPGSPADRAGVPVDAVVVAMDGQKVANSEELVALIGGARAGSDAELSYYVGDKLSRKSVKLAPGTVISTLPPRYGSERPLAVGPPGAERPLLSKVEKVVEGLTRPAAGAGADAADVQALQQSYSNMQAQMKLLLERIDDLEARVRSLEAVAAPKPAEEAAEPVKDTAPPRPKPSIPGANKPKPNPPKLNPPETP